MRLFKIRIDDTYDGEDTLYRFDCITNDFVDRGLMCEVSYSGKERMWSIICTKETLLEALDQLYSGRFLDE